jgi:hypothetical protein
MITCSIDGCDRERDTKGFCVGHYSRYKRHGNDFDRSPNFNQNYNRGGNTHGECDWPKCDVIAEYKNLCRRHYKWIKKHDINLDYIINDLEKGCESCGSTEDLCIDHDHSICSGKEVCEKCYRGILCRSCNLIAGYAKENIDTLFCVAAYLVSKNSMITI